MTTLAQSTTVVAAVGSGIIGGVFFAFSVVVMPALRHAPTPVGVRSMQAINRAAVHPPLMIALFGTALLCVGLIVWAIRSWSGSASAWVLAASGTYLISSVLVTVAANVPRNDALAGLDPDSATASNAWIQFVQAWTAWNHVRWIGGVAACAMFIVALLQARHR